MASQTLWPRSILLIVAWDVFALACVIGCFLVINTLKSKLIGISTTAIWKAWYTCFIVCIEIVSILNTGFTFTFFSDIKIAITGQSIRLQSSITSKSRRITCISIIRLRHIKPSYACSFFIFYLGIINSADAFFIISTCQTWFNSFSAIITFVWGIIGLITYTFLIYYFCIALSR